jgi:DNA-binding MarR family transcriptional regulator
VLDRSSETLIALRRIVHALEANAREMARASGLTQAQLLVLHTLARNGQEMPRDIARSLGVGQATISIQIDKLEMRGLVRRERRQADRRAVWVILTEAGRNLLDQTPDPLYERFSARFRDLSSWEQAMLMSVTERVAGMLDADDTTPLLHPAETSEAAALYPPEAG